MLGSTAGLAEGTLTDARNDLHNAFLVFLDIMFSSVIVTPAVIMHWRGTWNLSKMLIYPDDLLYNGIANTIIGIVGQFFFTYTQDIIADYLHPDKRRLTYMIGSRLYTLIYGGIGILIWLGMWDFLDLYCPSELNILLALTIISTVLLMVCKGFRNIASPPFGISTDNSKDYFQITTMFKSSATNEPFFFFLDCAFSVIVIGALVVLVWRSLWVLFDLLIFPDDLNLSAWYSIAIGYGITAITFAIQPAMKWTCDRLTGFWRIFVCDMFLFLSFVGTVNVWRGFWEILDMYFLPDDPFLSNILSHIVPFVLLALLNCSNSVLVRGVFIDAEEPAGQCVIFPVHYIRLFFQKERTKKRQKMLDALEKGDLSKELLGKLEKPQIVKSSSKSVEMTVMVNNRPQTDNGFYKKKTFS